MNVQGRRGRLAAAARALWIFCGAFSGATACWFLWEFLSTGDCFACDGTDFLRPSLVATAMAGGFAGFKTRSTRLRAALVMTALASALFWIAVPGGWWILPPPGTRLRVEPADPTQRAP